MPRIVIEPVGGKPRVIADKPYDLESVLQQNLASLPDLIPIDEAAGEPIEFLPIGVEIGVGAGALDILLLGADAILTIVETKLARNPESRREVVGQVLEYAAYVSEWSLEEIRRTADKHLEGGFDQALREFLSIEDTGDTGLDDFLNRLDQNQKAGRLRLIVATDKLVETALKTITFVNANSNFEIYLLQISCYEDPDGTRIYIPSLHGYARRVQPSPPRTPWTWERYQAELGWLPGEIERVKVLLARLERAIGGSDVEQRLHEHWIGLRYRGYERVGVQIYPRYGLELFFWLPENPLKDLPTGVESRQQRKYFYLRGAVESLTDDQLQTLCNAVKEVGAVAREE